MSSHSRHPGLGAGQVAQRQCSGKGKVHCARNCQLVGSDAGIDRLVTDLEDAPDAAADGHSPAIIVISLPIRAP